MATAPWVRRILAGILVLLSLAVFAFQGMNVMTRAFGNVLVYQREGNIPIFHLVAECLMATVTLAGAVGLWQGVRWGSNVALLGLGMFTYSAINSFGWALHNDMTQGIPMIVTVVVAAFAAPYLIRRMGGAAD